MRCERIHLAVGVPLKWMDSQKESFQAYLLQNPEIRFVYKGRRLEVSETDLVSVNTTDTNESVANADTEAKSLIEKDVVANDMLDLDSFFL